MILVTGASGFVGTRLCEHLRLGLALPVRALVHTPERAVRVARLDVDLVLGDLDDPASLARALDGCEAVVHCAYGTHGGARSRRRLTGEAAGALAELAGRAGVRRFVHLSSVAVWGFSPEVQELDESVPVRKTGHPYVDGKIESERLVLAAGVPAVVLRPTNVFGPWSPLFTVAPVETLRAGRIALAGDGAGPANLVYVDNVCHAVVRALESEEAVGGTFVVGDAEGPSWRGLYDAYASLLDPRPEVRTVAAVEAPARSLVRAAAESPALRGAARRVLGVLPAVEARVRRSLAALPDPPPSPELVALQTSGVRFRLDRARELLAYDPPVGWEQALRLTAEWLRFARLI